MKTQALLTLSARSVGRNARRSILTSAAMALGLALLMFSRALSDGGHEQWIESAVRLGTGHLAIQAPDYLETGRLEHRLDAGEVARIESFLGDPGPDVALRVWTPRLTVNGLASSAASALPVRIEGVDPERERAFTSLVDQLDEGRYLEPGDRLQAFIGAELARRLQIDPGDRMVVTAQTADGQVEGQLVRVVGTFRTGIQEIDEGLIHIPLNTARTWLGVPGSLTTVAVLLESSFETDAAVASLRDALVEDPGIRVLGWRSASPQMDSAVRIDDYGDYVFHVILFAIIALAILNSVLMAVLGRPGAGLRRDLDLLPRRPGLQRDDGGRHDGVGGDHRPGHRPGLPFRAGILEPRLHSRHRDGGVPLPGVPRVPTGRGGGHEIRAMNDDTASALAVRTEEVWKVYPQEPRPVEAVRGLSLEVAPGDFVAMAGPSGSGKTTVLNLLGGLTRPTRGRIWIGGKDATAMRSRELARLRLEHIGFVFQAYNLLPVLSALENAEFTLLLRGVPADERHRRVRALFAEMGLEGLEDRRPGRLSGGQQQRVAVARAVVGEPALVLADEPTANLDSATSAALLDIMEHLNREHGVTFVFSTHDPRVMERSRRLIRLVDGAIEDDRRSNGDGGGAGGARDGDASAGLSDDDGVESAGGGAGA
jgi:putative ABC transport system ATP-binding protein